MLKHPRVVGFGEIGLVHSVHHTYWSNHMSLLSKWMPMVPADKVLILHCRGIPGDSGMEVHVLLFHLLEQKISRGAENPSALFFVAARW